MFLALKMFLLLVGPCCRTSAFALPCTFYMRNFHLLGFVILTVSRYLPFPRLGSSAFLLFVANSVCPLDFCLEGESIRGLPCAETS